MTWRNLRISGILALSVGFSSCATTESYKTVQLPAFAGAYFADCSGNDGSVSMELFASGKVEQIFDADWTSNANGNWGIASYSPLGQTLFQLDYTQKSQAFTTAGKTFEAIDKLSVGSGRIVNYDGHDIGLKTDEVPCFLNHKLPQKWLKKIVSQSTTADHIEFVVVDGKRTINLAFAKNGGSQEFWNATIKWNLYWGFKKLQLSVRLLRDEPALIFHSDQFEKIDLRIVAQEE